MQRDWRFLGTPELLQVISEKLISISDYVCFRAVCPAWRSASSHRPRHLPPQLPWLVLPRGISHGEDDADLDSSLSMYDLSQSKTHTLRLPELHGKRICSTSHGWLVLEKEREVWLLNPITRDQISLPSLSVQPMFLIGGNAKNVKPRTCSYGIQKAILSSNPSSDPDFLTFALFQISDSTAFCRVGDDCWTIISTVEDNLDLQLCGVADIVYHNHLFYVIYVNGEAWKWDIRKQFCKIIHSSEGSPEGIDYTCTVERTCYEHGLMIFTEECWDVTRMELSMSDIRILSDKQESWLNIKETHASNYCFFLAGDFHCIALPLANLQLHGWDGNCICYISCKFERMNKWWSFSINLYKFDDRSHTSLASHVDLLQWHKSKFSRSPMFLWLTPTLC